MDNYCFWALIFRQKYIKRWGLMRNFTPESLSEHSTEVAFISHALAMIGNKYFGKSYNADRAVTLAVFHDVPEVYTGDLPTPIKYYDAKSRENYALIEEHAINALVSKLPSELSEEYRRILEGGEGDDDAALHVLVKASDKLCAYIKCLDEEKCGNRDFDKAKLSTYKSLMEMDCPELHWFIDNILPSFALTIDELQH